MERYCTIDEEAFKNIDEFKWQAEKDFKELSLFEIYEQMLKAYYFPISVFEQLRELMDETNEKEFIKKYELYKTIKESSIAHENASDENKKDTKILRYHDAKTDQEVFIEVEENDGKSKEKKDDIFEMKKADGESEGKKMMYLK